MCDFVTGPTILLELTPNPVRIDRASFAICKWSAEYKMSGYPHEKDTFITFWWKDVRSEKFAAICKIDVNPSIVTTCNEPDFSPDTPRKESEEKIYYRNVRYQGEGKCSFSTIGDSPIDSKITTLKVIGNCA